jgi:hypothetical protein
MKYVIILTSALLFILGANFLCSYLYINWLFNLYSTNSVKIAKEEPDPDLIDSNSGIVQTQYYMMEHAQVKKYSDNLLIVMVNNVIIRSNPRKSSAKIGHLNKGQQVLFLDQYNMWYKIKKKEIVGWIYKDFLK